MAGTGRALVGESGEGGQEGAVYALNRPHKRLHMGIHLQGANMFCEEDTVSRMWDESCVVWLRKGGPCNTDPKTTTPKTLK